MKFVQEIDKILFQETDFSNEAKFNKTIKVKVTEETFNRWKELNAKLNKIMEYENESKVFEFAIIEALNLSIFYEDDIKRTMGSSTTSNK
tara:strand:+ start:1853 stop:2122 length:270 start_codon:yes stop_codon:yes gene_type:complete